MAFFRDRAGEVDFLMHRGGRFHLAEAKWTKYATARDVIQLARVSKELTHVDRQAVICRPQNAYPVTPRIRALPLEAASEWLEN